MKTGSIRDYLYESPGPRTLKKIRVITGIAVLGMLVLLGLIVRQFSVTGQFDTKYWSFFTKWSRADRIGHFIHAGFSPDAREIPGKNGPGNQRFPDRVYPGGSDTPFHLFLFPGCSEDRVEAFRILEDHTSLRHLCLRCGG